MQPVNPSAGAQLRHADAQPARLREAQLEEWSRVCHSSRTTDGRTDDNHERKMMTWGGSWVTTNKPQ